MSMFFLFWILIAMLAIVSIPFLPLYYGSARLWNKMPEKTQNKTMGWTMTVGGAIISVGLLVLFVFLVQSFIDGKTGLVEIILGVIFYSIFSIPICICAICNGVCHIKNPLLEDSKNNDFTKTKLFDKLFTAYIFYIAILISVGWLYGAYQVFLKGDEDVIYYIMSLAMLLGYIALFVDIIIERKKNARKTNQV